MEDTPQCNVEVIFDDNGKPIGMYIEIPKYKHKQAFYIDNDESKDMYDIKYVEDLKAESNRIKRSMEIALDFLDMALTENIENPRDVTEIFLHNHRNELRGLCGKEQKDKL